MLGGKLTHPARVSARIAGAAVKEFRFISWTFHGCGGTRAAFAMLNRCDLRHLAFQSLDNEFLSSGESWDPPEPAVESAEDQHLQSDQFITRYRSTLGSWGCVRVPADDPRLPKLLEELERLGLPTATRLDRVYSQIERDNAHWLCRPGISTMAISEFAQQTWDRRNACGVCGAGSVAMPPLHLRVLQMPASGFVITAPLGQIVVSAKVAAALEKSGLSGFRLEAVVTARRGKGDDRYRWMVVTSQWSPYSGRTQINPDELCEACWRAGHYPQYCSATELHYEREPADACDFNITWEQWGCWSLGDRRKPPPRVGAAPILIVSQRARRTLTGLGVKTGWEPVFVGGGRD